MRRYSKFSPKHAFASAIVYGARDRNKRRNNDPEFFKQFPTELKALAILGHPIVLVAALLLYPKALFILIFFIWIPMIIFINRCK